MIMDTQDNHMHIVVNDDNVIFEHDHTLPIVIDSTQPHTHDNQHGGAMMVDLTDDHTFHENIEIIDLTKTHPNNLDISDNQNIPLEDIIEDMNVETIPIAEFQELVQHEVVLHCIFNIVYWIIKISCLRNINIQCKNEYSFRLETQEQCLVEL